MLFWCMDALNILFDSVYRLTHMKTIPCFSWLFLDTAESRVYPCMNY